MRPIRILIIDDHAVVRDGLAALIGTQADLRCIGTAASGRDGIALHRAQPPDVTVLDLGLPDIGGLEVLRRIRQQEPTARFVILTTMEADTTVSHAISAGAQAYILKETAIDRLLATIREVHGGDRVPPVRPARQRPLLLTPRELEVLRAMADGLRNKEIAAALVISENTVEVHAKNILSKLGVHDRISAVTLAFRRGLIDLAPG